MQLYDVKQVSRMLKIGRTSLYKLIGDGALPTIKIGKSTRISADGLDQFLAKCQPVVPAPKTETPPDKPKKPLTPLIAPAKSAPANWIPLPKKPSYSDREQ